jgi:hypothetical protein
LDPKALTNVLLFVIAAALVMLTFGVLRIVGVLGEATSIPVQCIVSGAVTVDGNVGVNGPIKVDAPMMMAPAPEATPAPQ